MTPSPVYLVPGLRTPFCKVDGPLKDFDAIQMSVPVAQAMANIARPDLMIWGTVIPSLRWSNIAREVLMDAKLDATIPAYSTLQACSTSMVGVFEAAGMLSDHAPLAMVGGVEAMSQVQIGLTQGLSNWLRAVIQARTLGQRLDAITGITLKDIKLDIPSVKNRSSGKSMGEHCEEMAKQWKAPRAMQDRIAYDSHSRAVKAMTDGFFNELIINVNGTAKDGIPRADSTLEKLATLKPAFDHWGRYGDCWQRFSAHRWRGRDLGGERSGVGKVAQQCATCETARLRNSRCRYLRRRIADGARLRDPASAGPSWFDARRHRPVGNSRSVRRTGVVQCDGH